VGYPWRSGADARHLGKHLARSLAGWVRRGKPVQLRALRPLGVPSILSGMDQVARIARDVMIGLAVVADRVWAFWAFYAGAPSRTLVRSCTYTHRLRDVGRDDELVRLLARHPSLAEAERMLRDSVDVRRRALADRR
jgi:hypothetical protein